jgi:hypothetical protein
VAEAAGVRGVATLKVEPGALADVCLSSQRVGIRAGENLRMEVWGEDRFGNRVSVTPRFSLEPPSLGTVTAEGLYRAQKAGTGILAAEVNGLRDSALVTVKTGGLQRIEIQPPATPLCAGSTYDFRAVGYDAGGNEIPVEPNWAVTPQIGRMDRATGRFSASTVGEGLVVAYAAKVMARAAVRVEPGQLHTLFIEPNPVTVKSGTQQGFEVKGFDVEENPIGLSRSAVQWNVTGKIGTFTEPGVFSATIAGKGKVTAAVGDLIAEAYVDVPHGEPSGLNSRVRVTYPTLPADGEAYSEVIVEVRDQHNNPVPGVQVTLVSSRAEDRVLQPEKTGHQGLARGRISSSAPGTATVSAVVGNQAFRDTARVSFE